MRGMHPSCSALSFDRQVNPRSRRRVDGPVFPTINQSGSLAIGWSSYGSTLMVTARCGPARRVVWEGGVKHPFLSLLAGAGGGRSGLWLHSVCMDDSITTTGFSRQVEGERPHPLGFAPPLAQAALEPTEPSSEPRLPNSPDKPAGSSCHPGEQRSSAKPNGPTDPVVVPATYAVDNDPGYLFR